MAAAARLALLLLGCVGLLHGVGECHGSGGSCFCSGARREPRSSAGFDAGCPSSLLPPNRWQVHKLLPRRLVLLRAQLLQVLL